MPLMDEDADLGYQGIGKGELGKGKEGYRELADADKPYAELGDGDESHGKLTYGNHPLGNHRHPIGTVLEGDVYQWKPKYLHLGLVFIPPAIPFGLGWIRSPTAWTGKGILTDIMLAGTAGLHGDPFCIVFHH